MNRTVLLALLLTAGTSASAQVRIIRAPGVSAPGAPVIGGGPMLPASRISAVRMDDLSLHSRFPLTGTIRPEAAPRKSWAPGTIRRDPQTRLYGVSLEKRQGVTEILKKHYGDDLLDLAAIGSRARGTASWHKGYRPVRDESDLDLAPLLRPSESALEADQGKIAAELKGLLGFDAELHVHFSFDGKRYSDSVPFHDGESEEPVPIPFRTGEAVRIPL